MTLETINIVKLQLTNDELATIIAALQYAHRRADDAIAIAPDEKTLASLNKTKTDCASIINKLLTGEF